MYTGITTPLCGHCGRPAVANGIYHGGLAYHPECTRGPSAAPTFAPGYAGPLTAEQVRQIVREELARLQVPNA